MSKPVPLGSERRLLQVRTEMLTAWNHIRKHEIIVTVPGFRAHKLIDTSRAARGDSK